MSNKVAATRHGGQISMQCANGRHAGGYAPRPAGEGRIVGDQFVPACAGLATLPATADHPAGLVECACTCHTAGAKLT